MMSASEEGAANTATPPKHFQTSKDSQNQEPMTVHYSYKGILAAIFYGSMSIASIFINKAIFHVYDFKFPYTVVFGQTLFTIVLLVAMRGLHVIRLAPFRFEILQKVSLLSFFFLLKLVLDMSALSRVNIPMYGVLKSATTVFVLLLDFILRDKRASLRIQLSVYMTALGGFVAGLGDLTFDLAGYVLALSSAMATAAYVVTVGKLGDELQLDSFTLMLYNNLWSLPFFFFLVLANEELPALYKVLHPEDMLFSLCFIASCASAFVLNLATYICTLVNDSLTTSIVGRTKSILQGLGGLFAFGDVRLSVMNLAGLFMNFFGVGWYAWEKYLEGKQKLVGYQGSPERGPESSPLLPVAQSGSLALALQNDHLTISRDGSQLTLLAVNGSSKH